MAVDGYWVTGPSLVYTGTGSASAYELLGYTERGAEIEIDFKYKEIMTDRLS